MRADRIHMRTGHNDMVGRRPWAENSLAFKGRLAKVPAASVTPGDLQCLKRSGPAGVVLLLMGQQAGLACTMTLSPPSPAQVTAEQRVARLCGTELGLSVTVYSKLVSMR